MASSQEFKTQNHLLSQLSNMALDCMYVGTARHLPQLGLEHRIHSTFCPGSTLVFLPALVRLNFFSDSPIELSRFTQYLKNGRSYVWNMLSYRCICQLGKNYEQSNQSSAPGRLPLHHDVTLGLAYREHLPSSSIPGFVMSPRRHHPIRRTK
jgi:hypothetical protein